MDKKHKKQIQEEAFVERLNERFTFPLPKEKISLSLIIPVYNCSERITQTLESVSRQNYPFLEVIAVDAGSSDRTVEIINTFPHVITRIYSVAEYNISDMMNRGISLSSGRYVAFLFAGSYYLSDQCFAAFAKKVVQEGFPDLVYCGSIQREIKREPLQIFHPFSARMLQKGKTPASLAACWMRSDLFDKVGKFNRNFLIRTGFDFLCRVKLEKETHVAALEHFFVDFDYGLFSYGKILRMAQETWSIIYFHFGLIQSFIWLLSVNHLIIVKWIFKGMKRHLLRR